MIIRTINATVLFVQDLDKCLRFYRDTLGLEVAFSDDVSHALRLEGHDFVLLQVTAAVAMISADAVLPQMEGGHRALLCAGVDDVDATYEALTAKGIAFIKPPKSQAWGRRTAYFADPEGNLWELYQMLDAQPQA